MSALDPVESDLVALTSYNRLQGSIGLAQAADLVAERAEAAGLTVDLRWYQPHPDRRWWTFAMPLAPSPVSARLSVDGSHPVVDYPGEPMCLARGSGSTPPGGVVASLAADGDTCDRFVLLTADEPALVQVERLVAAGALGFARQSPPRDGDPDVVDRLEVPDGCPLVAFSVSTRQFALLRTALAARARVHVEAVHAPPAPMPLVHASSPARPGGRYALLSAHLCHPAPGANDNVSGVAALLALARALGTGRADPPPWGLRLLWAPEIVGAAAYAHDVLPELGDRPEFALSVDMVGRPDLPLIIEAPPNHLASPLPAALDLAADVVCPPGPSYSGAVRIPAWQRYHTPFVGASDHLIFADSPTGIPAAALGGWPDPYRHSSRDALAGVSPRYVARIAATLELASRWLLTGEASDAIADRVYEIAVGHVFDAVRRVHLATPRRPEVCDPYQPGQAAATLRLLGTAGEAALTRLAGAHPPVAARCARHRQALRATVAGLAATLPVPARSTSAGAAETGQPLVRAWAGPLNLRAMRDTGPAPLRTVIDGYPHGYPWMTAVALAVDGRRDARGVLARAAASAQIDLPLPAAAEFLDALLAAGWVRPAPAAGRRRSGAPASAR